MALPKHCRISDQKLLQLLNSYGQRRISDSFTLIFNKNCQSKDFKVKVAIGKKIDKKAVVRNMIKRKIYKAFEEIQKSNNFIVGDFLVLPKRKIILKDQKNITWELLNILLDEGFIKRHV